MAHHIPNRQHQQAHQPRCNICILFQAMGRGQYRSAYDREMYLHHLQIAHGVKLNDELGNSPAKKGDVLKE